MVKGRRDGKLAAEVAEKVSNREVSFSMAGRIVIAQTLADILASERGQVRDVLVLGREIVDLVRFVGGLPVSEGERNRRASGRFSPTRSASSVKKTS